MKVEPTDKYIEELCDAFHTAFIATEEVLGVVMPDYQYHKWEDVPDDVREPIRIAVRSVVEFIQADIKGHVHLDDQGVETTHVDTTDMDEIAEGQIADHLGSVEDEYTLEIKDNGPPKVELDPGYLEMGNPLFRYLAGGKDD